MILCACHFGVYVRVLFLPRLVKAIRMALDDIYRGAVISNFRVVQPFRWPAGGFGTGALRVDLKTSGAEG